MKRLILVSLFCELLLEATRDPFSVRQYAKKTAGFVLKGTVMSAHPYAALEHQGRCYLVELHEKIGKYTVVEIIDGEVGLKKGEQVMRLRLKEAESVSKKK